MVYVKGTRLKPEHQKFVAEYIRNGGNGTRAVKKIKPHTTRGGAAVTSTRLLKDRNIAKAIEDALRDLEATPEFAVAQLKKVAEQDEELGAKRLASKDILELHGWRKNDKPIITLDIQNGFFGESREVIDL